MPAFAQAHVGMTWEACDNLGIRLPQRYLLYHFINRSSGLQNALEIHQFLHIGMEISLLLDAVANLQEELLVDQRLDTADGEMRHKVLAVTEIAQVVEGIQKVGFEVEQGLGLVVHAEP